MGGVWGGMWGGVWGGVWASRPVNGVWAWKRRKEGDTGEVLFSPVTASTRVGSGSILRLERRERRIFFLLSSSDEVDEGGVIDDV